MNTLLRAPKKFCSHLFRKGLHFYANHCKRRDVINERYREECVSISGLSQEFFTPLTKDEKNKVVAMWGDLLLGFGMSFKECEVYKHFRGFDERFLPFQVYLPLVSRRLNDYRYTKIYEHKSLLGRLTQGELQFPKCIVRCINKEYYSDDMSELSYEEAVTICLKYEKVIVKIAQEIAGGHGVQCLNKEKLGHKVFECEIRNMLLEPKVDFVIQEYLQQSPYMAKFNPDSVNTLRIQTLYLNGKFSVGSIILRMGNPGSLVDNLCSGGVVVGVNNDGRLHDFGYNAQLEVAHRHSGITFKDECIPELTKILEKVKADHIHQFSLCKYIGWDIMINENGCPVCIEVNTSQNGALPFQICCGPVFGERTKEVINYCMSKPFIYNKAIGRY